MKPQFDRTQSRHIDAFFIALGVREYDAFLDVAVGLPEVARVGFLDVYDKERRAVLVLLIELVEGGNLPPEGRSSVTAEDEHDGLHAAEGRELDTRFLVLGFEREVGRGITDLQMSGARVQPEWSEGKHHERQAGHGPHDAAGGWHMIV